MQIAIAVLIGSLWITMAICDVGDRKVAAWIAGLLALTLFWLGFLTR